MDISQELKKYLRGEIFSNSLTVDLDRDSLEASPRENVITEIVKGMSVIHVGCSDHIPLIRDKIAANKWLHKLITDNSEKCIGIDIDSESIEFIKRELGYKNVVHGNIITDDIDALINGEWDYVVFGEVIEHLDNPAEFLSAFRVKYGMNVERFIVTVPNVFTSKNLKNMLQFREEINSDHRFWFTPYTISKLLVSAGLNPEKITYANLMSLGTFRLISRKVKRIFRLPVKYPFYYFNTLIVTGTLK